MTHDPISDMLTRIRNASAIGKTEVVLPYSKMKFAIANILKEEGYINDVKEVSEGKFKELKIVLKYKKDGKSSIKKIRRISKPGLRLYAGKNELPTVLNNLGIAIISTPRGIMTNKTAKDSGLGGEIICEVY